MDKKGVSLPINQDLSSDDPSVSKYSLVLSFSNFVSHKLYSFLQAGGNGGGGRTTKKLKAGTSSYFSR